MTWFTSGCRRRSCCRRRRRRLAGYIWSPRRFVCPVEQRRGAQCDEAPCTCDATEGGAEPLAAFEAAFEADGIPAAQAMTAQDGRSFGNTGGVPGCDVPAQPPQAVWEDISGWSGLRQSGVRRALVRGVRFAAASAWRIALRCSSSVCRSAN
jgi:hypothetical protein